MPQTNSNNPAPRGVQYRKNKYAAPVAGVFIFLAVLGLISLTILCVRFTQSLLDNSGEKQRFEQVILPVLMFDPPAFEKPGDLSPEFLLQSSLWSTLLGDKRTSYQYDAIGRLSIPASDVDVSCARLYGSEVKLTHQTIGNYETMYVYDDTTKTYFVPVDGLTGLYTPSVERVVKNGDVYTLTVGYIPPTNAFTRLLAEDTGKTPADKYMMCELLKVKDHYQFTALRYMPNSGGSGNTAGLPVVSSSAADAQQPSSSLAAPQISSSVASSSSSSPADASSSEESAASGEEETSSQPDPSLQEETSSSSAA